MTETIILNPKPTESIVQAMNPTITLTSNDVLNALDQIREIPKQIIREMKDVTKNIDISNLQDLIDFDWGQFN
jgi:hypothetical protein